MIPEENIIILLPSLWISLQNHGRGLWTGILNNSSVHGIKENFGQGYEPGNRDLPGTGQLR